MKFQRPNIQHLPDALQCWKKRGCNSCLMSHRERARQVLNNLIEKGAWKVLDYVEFLTNWGLVETGLGAGYESPTPVVQGKDLTTNIVEIFINRRKRNAEKS